MHEDTESPGAVIVLGGVTVTARVTWTYLVRRLLLEDAEDMGDIALDDAGG